MIKHIPDSIKFLVELEKMIQKSPSDYHEGLSFMLWIVMYVIGDWAVDIFGGKQEIRQQLISHIDNINLYIENQLMGAIDSGETV